MCDDSVKMSKLSPNIALNDEALLQKAAAQTGLSDFGDDSFREPFGILLSCRVVLIVAYPLGALGVFGGGLLQLLLLG